MARKTRASNTLNLCRQVDKRFCINGFAMDGEHYKPFSYENNPEAYHEIVEGILRSSKDRKIGMFAENDDTACSLLNACCNLGVAVPDDVGIVGYDNSEKIAMRSPIPLTTIKQDFFEIGKKSDKWTKYRKF